MKFSLVFLLPSALAFAPSHIPSGRAVVRKASSLRNDLDDAIDKVTGVVEEDLPKADSLLLSRAMRVVDHIPMLYTLKVLTNKAGISASLNGVTSNPSAFGGLSTALAVPTWCFNVWTLIAISQVVSAARSVLLPDGNELSQADITANTAANLAAARLVGSTNPLRDTILAAVVSGYSLRSGNMDGAASIRNMGIQLMSSFTTILAVLGLVQAACTCSIAPGIISGNTELIQMLGLLSFYGVATRDGNGTVKKVVSGGVAAGMFYAVAARGIKFSSIFSDVGTIGLVYVAYLALNRVRKAIFS